MWETTIYKLNAKEIETSLLYIHWYIHTLVDWSVYDVTGCVWDVSLGREAIELNMCIYYCALALSYLSFLLIVNLYFPYVCLLMCCLLYLLLHLLHLLHHLHLQLANMDRSIKILLPAVRKRYTVHGSSSSSSNNVAVDKDENLPISQFFKVTLYITLLDT